MLCKRAFLGGAMDKVWLEVRIPSSIDILQDSIREKPAWFYDILQISFIVQVNGSFYKRLLVEAAVFCTLFE